MPIRSIRSRMTWSFVPLLTVLLALLAYWQMPQVDGYDYFKLVQQWPESSCNTGKFSCPPPIKRDFTIHGLWPASSSGLDPTQCKPSVITKQQLGPLVPSLVDNWPQLANPTANGSLGFWQYEWNKHGSCSESVFAVFNYFQSALILKANNNITKFLEVAGLAAGFSKRGIPRLAVDGASSLPSAERVFQCLPFLQEVRPCGADSVIVEK